MSEYLTVPNALLLLSILGNAYALLRWVAPRTVTTYDDTAVEAIDKAKAWANAYAPTAWEYLEAAQKKGLIPAGSSKAVEFLLLVRDAYRQAHAADLPKPAEQVAVGIAAGLSQAEKLTRNPSPAPVSQ